MELDLDFVRRLFPALGSGWALFDNAGGSVTARPVIERITDYLETYQVQLGASYALSEEATARVREGEAAAATWIGAEPGEAVVGPSTTMNLKTLSRALAPMFAPGDRVVVTDLDHEADIGCWRDLASHGIEILTWKLDPERATLDPDALAPLLGPRTKLVCFTHCANVVGEILDVSRVAAMAHDQGALVCVDGVAFAPHRRIDVKALDVDFYALSFYKVYGPHLGLLYGKREHLLRAKGSNHFFVGEDDLPYKHQPGNVTHELAAGLPGIPDYFDRLARHHLGRSGPEAWSLVYDLIAMHETRLAERFLRYLRERSDVRIVGPETADPSTRVPTIAFTVDGRRSSEIPPIVDTRRVAIRFGHFYAARAIEALGLDDRDGVVRVSMVHYNTLDEVDRLIEALDEALG